MPENEEKSLRVKQEQREHEIFSPYAAFSDKSLGRDKYEPQCDIRTIYQRDRDRILHCKAFRRLKDKTQVFLAPEGDHYRTRLTHTLEVAQNARTIARALRLNEDLTEAIALGHDLGHTPFGHAGERALNAVCAPEGFQHARQSLRVVEHIEKEGEGLNLTKEVRDGILNHKTGGKPKTLEGKIVQLSDKIAYVNHDIDDAIRGKIIMEEDIPKEYTDILGNSVRNRLNCMIHDIVNNSEGKNDIIMSKDVKNAVFGLRSYMFEAVYTNPVAKGQENKAMQLVQELYYYYIEHQELLPKAFLKMIENGQPAKLVVCDYIAGMTDHYAISKYNEIKVPLFWGVY